MMLADDKVLGPCPRRCGGVVLILGPTIRALRAENYARRAVEPPKDELAPRCCHCDYRVIDREAYLADLREWRTRVMADPLSAGGVTL